MTPLLLVFQVASEPAGRRWAADEQWL